MEKSWRELRNKLSKYNGLIDRKKELEYKLNELNEIDPSHGKLTKSKKFEQDYHNCYESLKYLNEGIDEMDNLLKDIEKYCGKDGLNLILEVYAEKSGTKNISHNRGYSRRTIEEYLKFYVLHYLKRIKIKNGETPWKTKIKVIESYQILSLDLECIEQNNKSIKSKRNIRLRNKDSNKKYEHQVLDLF